MIQEKLDSAKNLFFIALATDMAVTTLVVITDFWAVGVLNDIRAGVTKADQITIGTIEFWESFSKVMILTLIGVGLALVRWLDACYEYAKEVLKATGFDQEGWKTWGWMVPFMNLFKPYQVLAEIYRAGANGYLGGEKWKTSAGSWMLLVWWIFWVIAHMVMGGITKYGLKYSFKDDLTLSQIIGMYYGSVTVCVISLIVAGLWFVVAENLTRRLLNRSVPYIGSAASLEFTKQAQHEQIRLEAENAEKSRRNDDLCNLKDKEICLSNHIRARFESPEARKLKIIKQAIFTLVYIISSIGVHITISGQDSIAIIAFAFFLWLIVILKSGEPEDNIKNQLHDIRRSIHALQSYPPFYEPGVSQETHVVSTYSINEAHRRSKNLAWLVTVLAFPLYMTLMVFYKIDMLGALFLAATLISPATWLLIYAISRLARINTSRIKGARLN